MRDSITRNLRLLEVKQDKSKHIGVVCHQKIMDGAIDAVKYSVVIIQKHIMCSEAAQILDCNSYWGWLEGHREVYTCKHHYFHR